MRIITGSARGVRLATLEGDATRPTGERAKEAIFSALQFSLQDRRVLDLFAGSGQMGLEALSRGAESAMFVDASQDAIAIVKANAQKTKLFDKSRFLISDYRNYIRKMKGKQSFDLFFLDPPYASDFAREAIERILQAGIADEDALFVCETPAPLALSEEVASRFEVVKEAKYGIAYVTILRLLDGGLQ